MPAYAGKVTAEAGERTQSKEEMYADDGYVEQGVADPGTMQDQDPAGESYLAEEEEREELDDRPHPAAREGEPNPPLTQRQADASDAIDRGFMEDREGERDEEEGRSPSNAETIDPLEET
jgi:hypothetical protein